MAKRNGEDILKAEYFRQHAECLRAIGSRLRSHDKNRVTLLNMADYFDCLANQAQENLSMSRLRRLKSVSASLFGFRRRPFLLGVLVFPDALVHAGVSPPRHAHA
jgi:hypothetical protein